MTMFCPCIIHAKSSEAVSRLFSERNSNILVLLAMAQKTSVSRDVRLRIGHNALDCVYRQQVSDKT
jgi:hypothetical protein